MRMTRADRLTSMWTRTQTTPGHRAWMVMIPGHRVRMVMTLAIRVMLHHLKKVTTRARADSLPLSLQERKADAGAQRLHVADKVWCGWVS